MLLLHCNSQTCFPSNTKSICHRSSDLAIFGQMQPFYLLLYLFNTYYSTKYMSMMYVCKQIQAKKRPSIILLTYLNDTMIVFQMYCGLSFVPWSISDSCLDFFVNVLCIEEYSYCNLYLVFQHLATVYRMKRSHIHLQLCHFLT